MTDGYSLPLVRELARRHLAADLAARADFIEDTAAAIALALGGRQAWDGIKPYLEALRGADGR